jgi:uncharacterized protein (DUF1778 family)
MPPEKQSRTKTQTLSLRLDPKTRFILEFMSRVRGQSITVVVERAIKEAAEQATIGHKRDEFGNEVEHRTWLNYWDPDESVRQLMLFGDRDYYTTFEEDEIRRFTEDHWDFFYTSSTAGVVRRSYANVLWPNLSKYLKTWNTTRMQDYWAAGRMMADDLKRAGIAAPAWPRNETRKEPPATTSLQKLVRDLDDEVPF